MSPRLFFGVPLASRARDSFAAILENLRSSSADVQWVRSTAPHLTLAFLGETPREKVEPASAAGRAAAGREPFTAALSSIGVFNDWDRPRVLWIGVGRGAPELSALAQALHRELSDRSFPLEDRPFVPHITLGRIRSRRGLDELKARVDLLSASFAWSKSEFLVAGFTLFQSLLKNSGAEHRVLEEIALGSSAAAGRNP